MRFQKVCIEGLAYALPEEVVTSAQIEQWLAPAYERLGFRPGRLEMMSGIRERRFFKKGALPSDAAAEAGAKALAQTGTRPEEIGCLVHTSVSRDCLEPSTASIVHHKMGLPSGAFMFDISNACLGFINGMIVVANMIMAGHIKKGLVVSAENSRQLVESTIQAILGDDMVTRRRLNRAFASLTIGSGAVAMILAHEAVAQAGHELLGGDAQVSSQDSHLCKGSEDTGFAGEPCILMETDSEQLLLAGCNLAQSTWRTARSNLGWHNGEPARCFTHQVGTAHRERLYESLGLSPSLDYSTVEELGNMGSASLPVTFAKGVEEKPPHVGDPIALMGIGSGLSCVMLGVKW